MNTPTETPTPRTDAEHKKWWGDNRPGMSSEYVTADFARGLERELDQWRTVAGELAKAVEIGRPCWPNACGCMFCRALDEFTALTR
jgi:hypothetical protein